MKNDHVPGESLLYLQMQTRGQEWTIVDVIKKKKNGKGVINVVIYVYMKPKSNPKISNVEEYCLFLKIIYCCLIYLFIYLLNFTMFI